EGICGAAAALLQTEAIPRRAVGARTLDQGSDPQSARGSERVLRGWTPALHEDDEWGCGGRRVSRGKRARRSEARSEGCTGSDRGARGDVVAWCTSARG